MRAAAPDPALGNLQRMCVVGFLAYCSYAMCRIPLLPLLARDLGADAATLGFVMSASTLTGAVVKLPAGAWSDVLGRRPLLVLAAVIYAVMPLTYFTVGSLVALMLVRFVHGSASAIFGPVAAASLSDVAPAGRRGAWMSTYATVQGAGQAVGPVLAGYLIAGGRYDLAFAVAAALAFATPFLVSRWPAGRVVEGRARGAELRRGVGEVIRHRLILATSLVQSAQFVLHGTLSAFLPLFAREELGIGVASLGWLFGLQTLTTLLTRPLIGAASDRVGRRWLIVAGVATSGTAVVLVPLAAGMASLAPVVMLYAIGVGVTTAAAGAFITDLARQANYGAAHGVFGTIYDVGDALGPITAGFLVVAVGYGPMFRIVGGVALVAAGLFAIVARDVRSRNGSGTEAAA